MIKWPSDIMSIIINWWHLIENSIKSDGTDCSFLLVWGLMSINILHVNLPTHISLAVIYSTISR
jgi:hypothetical protein